MNDLLGRSIKPALLIVGPAVDKHVRRTAQNVDAVEELILSHETTRNSQDVFRHALKNMENTLNIS